MRYKLHTVRRTPLVGRRASPISGKDYHATMNEALHRRHRPVLGYLAALASAALVGCFTVLTKWLLTEDVQPVAAGAWT
jgi:drug/metabolite transporter (DMT)-like permease